ncbi:hypothetical protein [Neobacillus vireti]|uniref:hypothetical protein n=1 Tax=Neobacillus vireti TaxID=220686 RepID=UPI002FFD5F78
MSEKLEKFERLAEKRVTEAIKKIRLISNLSNRNNYDYSEKHVKQIIDSLEIEIKYLKSRFSKENTNEDIQFSFKKD